jgi:formylglycine-generating enzyme required for sulfatase activity
MEGGIIRNSKICSLGSFYRGLVFCLFCFTTCNNCTEVSLREKDGMVQVLIPGGSFFMGSDRALDPDHEKPMLEVSLSPFFLDRFEISVSQFSRCVAEKKCSGVSATWNDAIKPELPVRGVSWKQARQYCHWVNSRLPTEAEWEFAARGKNSLRYPWGSSPNPGFLEGQNNPMPAQSTDFGSPSTGPGGFGVFHLHDNISEWVMDSTRPPKDGRLAPRRLNSKTQKRRKSRDYKDDSPSEFKVVKGAHYQTAFSAFQRASFRFALHEDVHLEILGFRCVSQP